MRRVILAALAVVAVVACNRSQPGKTNAAAGKSAYDVEVTRTALGIPHIKANDYGSLGYGYGYAHAEDNLCVLMEDLVTNKGERAKYFGRNGTPYLLQANGASAPNVDSDFFWKLMADDAAVARIKAKTVPDGIAASQGFAAGFSRYVRELKSGQHPGRHTACRDAPWLREITEDDMYRRYYRLVVLASSSVFVPGIGTAQPPVAGLPSGLPAGRISDVQKLPASERPWPFGGELAIGSNMYGIGKEASATGQTMLFGNPHFPWIGTERLWLAHLTVPGQADIMGVSLYGVPAVLIGFNDHFAWSHTVSTAYRFSFYELTMVPGDPTSYLYEGVPRKLTPVPMSIEVTEDDGSVTTQSRTLYRSHYGPMVGFNVSGQNILPWTPVKAYTLRDANAENDRLINQFFAWDRAQSLDEFKRLHASVLGVPWVNTVAAGPDQPVYYGDVTVVPNVPDQKAQLCGTSAQAQALNLLAPGLPLLDGSRAMCEWDNDADAPAPGIFGPKNLPTLVRDDHVSNFNDSYWLTNPARPVEGYDKIIGAERSARSLRTRLGLLQLQRRIDGTDGREGKKFTMENLQDVVLSSASYSAELALDSVLTQTCALGMVLTQSGPVDVSGACDALAGWDRTYNRDARGGHVWREFWTRAIASPGGLPLPVSLAYNTPFLVTDPVNTPRGFNAALPTAQQALGDTVKLFNGLGLPLDERLGALQKPHFASDIEVFGSVGNTDGSFTIARGPLSETGYSITYGNSYIQTVTWEKDGAGFKPRAEGFVTYSQSTDPASPHYSDFTREYSEKRWKRLPFRPSEIEADKISSMRLTE